MKTIGLIFGIIMGLMCAAFAILIIINTIQWIVFLFSQRLAVKFAMKTGFNSHSDFIVKSKYYKENYMSKEEEIDWDEPNRLDNLREINEAMIDFQNSIKPNVSSYYTEYVDTKLNKVYELIKQYNETKIK